MLLDGLDEVHSVGNLANIGQPAGHPEKPGIPGKGALNTEVTPLQFTQCLLTGSLLQGNLLFLTRIFPKNSETKNLANSLLTFFIKTFQVVISWLHLDLIHLVICSQVGGFYLFPKGWFL